jgi:pyridoxamine 5'-phosphate oxidase
MTSGREISDYRREYRREGLLEEDAKADPIEQFRLWFDEAEKEESLDVTAMTLATTSAAGRPSARIVLLKAFDESGFVFFTNYESRKADEMQDNPTACLLFYWPVTCRQVRLEGRIEKVAAADSEAYFKSRPFESKIAALVSPQSYPVTDRRHLDEQFEITRKKYADGDVPLPAFWGGYRLMPDRIEFWQGRLMRLHDRLVYERNGSEWEIHRIAP